MKVILVAAVARNRVIGRDNELPWHIPEDMRRFREMTTGKSLIMGRKTFESIGRPLPDRTNVVVTRQEDWEEPQGVLKAGSLEEALKLVGVEAYVIGGAEIYEQALVHADVLELTEVHDEPEGDTWFPEVDWSQWVETFREDHDGFSFVTYKRV